MVTVLYNHIDIITNSASTRYNCHNGQQGHDEHTCHNGHRAQNGHTCTTDYHCHNAHHGHNGHKVTLGFLWQ